MRFPGNGALHACAAALASAIFAAQADPASCPQLDYVRELPPVATDPRLVIDAAHAQVGQSGISMLDGSVHLSQNGRAFTADAVNYDDANRVIHVDSQSLFRDPRLVVKSARADYDLNAESGNFYEAQFTAIAQSGRGAAQHILVKRSGYAEFDNGDYTTCAPGNEAWLLQAGRLQLDRDSGLGTAHDAVLRFQGVPVLYTPYFQFPIDGERHTGFLAPVIGESSNRGFDVRAPFYINLAPNYDATLIPRYMSDRGEQIGGRFRYLLPASYGTGYAYGEYLPYDAGTGQQRSYFDFKHEGLINRRLAVEAEFAEVSDRAYFADFGGSINLSSTAFLTRGARLTYAAPAAYTVEALVQGYQPISSQVTGLDNPYLRLPQIRFATQTQHAEFDTRAGFDGEFTNFARAGSVEGQRLIAQPYVRWQRDQNSWYAGAQADLSYTAYALTDTAPGQPADPRRTLPLYSVEGGLRFERAATSGLLQTLEPHIEYLRVPYRNQDSLPLFDSGQPDFDFPQLFARNRYSGQDRIADANQLTSALTTRLIDPAAGYVRMTASLGEIYYLRAPRVDLPGINLPSTGSSDYIASVDVQLTPSWAITASAQWTPDFDRFLRSAIGLRYREQNAGLHGRRVDLSYRYRDGLLEQADASFSSPIDGNWRIASRLRYSLRDSRSLESFAGLEYETCCWAMQATYRRYLSSNTGAFSNGVYFQVDLKGLSKIGNGFDELLPARDPDAAISRRGAVGVVP